MTLLDAIAEHGFDAAFGGARRDEERARAKERIFSFRDDFGQWDPKNQRPELWNLYNGRIHKGEHVRVFPISNWTELDVWEYIDAGAAGGAVDLLRARARGVQARRHALRVARGHRADRRRGGLQRDRPLPHGRRHELHRRRALAGRARSRRSSPRSPPRGSPSAARRAPTTASPRPRWRTARRPGTSDAQAPARAARFARGACAATASAAMTLDLLRFTTAGSVDDGKSTLIGRLLYDSKQVFEDQLEHVAQASERRGGEGALDLALLTDGLRAEREQGITIDVAYRYFATPQAALHHRRLPGPPAVHAQHGHRRLDGRPGGRAGRRAHGACSSSPSATRSSARCWASRTWSWRSTRWTSSSYSQERFEELVAEFDGFAAKLATASGRRRPDHLHPDLGARTATTSSSARERCAGTTARRCSSCSSRSRSPTTTPTTARRASRCSG